MSVPLSSGSFGIDQAEHSICIVSSKNAFGAPQEIGDMVVKTICFFILINVDNYHDIYLTIMIMLGRL